MTHRRRYITFRVSHEAESEYLSAYLADSNLVHFECFEMFGSVELVELFELLELLDPFSL